MQMLPLMLVVENPGPALFMLPLLLIAFAFFAFWLWMLIDALTNQPTTNDKILWFLVIFFLNFLGAVIYFFVGRRKGT